MSTAGAAGGRRAQCEADGQKRACCGSRACMGDGFGDPAALGVRGGKDWATHHPNCNLMATSLSRQLSRGKSSHLVVLRSKPVHHGTLLSLAERRQASRAKISIDRRCRWGLAHRWQLNAFSPNCQPRVRCCTQQAEEKTGQRGRVVFYRVARSVP